MSKAGLRWVVLILAFAVTPVAARMVALPSTTTDVESLERALPEIAREMLATYEDANRDAWLVNRMRLQTLSGDWSGSIASIQELRELRRGRIGAPHLAALFLQYEIHADAAQRGEKTVDAAFRRAFERLDDRASARALPVFGADLPQARRDLDAALARHAGQSAIALADALELMRLAQFHQVYAELLPRLPTLLPEEDRRRFLVETEVVVPGADGASLRGIVVRPRSAKGPQPTLLSFTIYAHPGWSLGDAKAAAAHGYIGVVVFSRGKAGSTGPVLPYEHDGKDAAAVIDWIAAQPWSDGRVGMYGSSYNSFAQWAAAKHRPKALKAMLTSASAAPGIDVPMQGGIFQNFIVSWPLWVTGSATLDDDVYSDPDRWARLDREWYRSGRPYRELPEIDGHPNPVLARWLEHPDYDAYWQALIPQGEEYAGVDIPVLAVTGYFDGARPGVQHYYDQHRRHNPGADHTLLIGPWGHFAMQTGVARFVEGYEVDRAALIDLPALRYEWFDHVFRGAPRPRVLQDRVNYQVMGADTWKHAPSIEAMASERLRLHLHPASEAGNGRLTPVKPPSRDFSAYRVDLGDRSDADRERSQDSLTASLETEGGLVFASEPLTDAVELSGLFSGSLDFWLNKRDMDLTVSLYEQLPDGRYLLLAWHLGRASYAEDRRQRRLLEPGKRQSLDFRSERLVSRQLQPGSRLVVVLGVNRRSDMQINYGSGKDVSDESIANAGEPLDVRWYGTSWVEVPLRR